MRLPRGERKGLFFIHAMTLWRDHDAMRGTTVDERYQPQAGGSKKQKKPLGMASVS